MSTEIEALDREIGERMRRARKARGLTQAELGNALGVSFQQVQKYERGVNRLSSAALAVACKVLDVSPLEIMGMDDAIESQIDWELLTTKGSDELLKAYREVVSPDLRRSIIDLVRAIARNSAR